MRKLTLILALLMVALSGHAKIKVTNEQVSEALSHFRLINKATVIWECEFATDSSTEDIREWFINNLWARGDSLSLSGTTVNTILYDRDSGIPSGNTPGVVLYPGDVSYIAQISDGRYKVVVTDIVWHPQGGVNLGLISLGIGSCNLTDLAKDGYNFSWTFSTKTAYGLNEMLKRLFNIN